MEDQWWKQPFSSGDHQVHEWQVTHEAEPGFQKAGGFSGVCLAITSKAVSYLAE